MSCERFDRYRNGEGTAEDFARHVRDCAECRELAAHDARLDREIAALRTPVVADGLWERIEASLIREKRLAAEPAGKRAPGRPWLGALLARRWPILVPAGAAVALLVVLGLIGLRRPIVPSGILASEALARVEQTEKEYLGAIASLERQAQPKIAAMVSAEMSLYEDKLAVIDAQILRCREALASNPGNAHIRGYLLAALQDKRQTLADALVTMN
jgi:anti-sigma factor RsiW